MADEELAKKIAEAKKKMFGNQQYSGNVVLLVAGDARVETTDKKIEIRKVSS